MSKITPEHLARQAVVYIRQSTADQVANNLESKRRQYGLADRARQLGWSDVAIIDDDLGRSGGGVARPGFEKLLAAICDGRVGAVVSIEASRLARNGRDWHTLLEFCGLVGTLIARRGRRLRSASSQRPPAARHEGNHERDGAVGAATALAGGLEAEGAPRRTVHDGCHRLRAGRQQQHREGSGSAHCGSHYARVREVYRDAVGASGAPMAQARAHPVARRHLRCGRARDRVEAAGLQHDPAHPDQPDLCRRLCVRTHRQPRQHRGRPQEGRSRLQEGAQGLGGIDPESPRGLSELGGLREEPQA